MSVSKRLCEEVVLPRGFEGNLFKGTARWCKKLWNNYVIIESKTVQKLATKVFL